MSLEPGEEFKVNAWIVLSETQENHYSIKHFLDLAWQIKKDKIIPSKTVEEIWDLGVRYAKESLWAEDGSYEGFSIGLHLYDGKWEQRRRWKYEAGWCGQNISLANSLLIDYLMNADSSSLEKAIKTLDTWSEKTILPNGLMRTHYDYILGLSTNQERLDACNLGTAARNYFDAFELAKNCGYDRPQYKSLALGICDFMREDQQASGRYGKAWNIEGECIDREGTIGAFLIMPMLKASEVTGNNVYLESARKAYNYYMNNFKENGYTSAGALDTYCIDKESAITLLRSSIELFEMTDSLSYLDDAEAVSWYLSTWMWHYEASYDINSDFERYNWSTMGGTSVSVQHHHLDPYALFWVSEWFRLSQLTGNNIWKEKAMVIWHNGCQLVSDGNLKIHGFIRPVGSQNEGFINCNWRGEPGTVNDWLVAWPTAFRLETLRKMDWDGVGGK